MAFRLPRLPRNVALIDTKTGNPTLEFQRWWQSTVETIEAQEAAQDAIIASVVAAQAAAAAAQAAATTAQTAAVAAQASADAALGDIGVIEIRTEPTRSFLALY